LRSSAQRPLPFSTQSMSNGSSWRGSPKGTMDSLKRTVTCRTALTSPSGENNSMPASPAWAAWLAMQSSAQASRQNMFVITIPP